MHDANAIVHSQTPPRKGRPPSNGRAMTTAERKRKQRQRTKEVSQNNPTWLQLRIKVFALALEKFPFANADELASAFRVVGLAINSANLWEASDLPDLAKNGLLGVSSPEVMSDHFALFPEYQPYAEDARTKQDYPRASGRSLIKVFCDIFESHEKQVEVPQ